MVSRTGKGASKDSTASVLAELVAKSGPLSVYTGMPTKTAQSIVQSFTYYYFYAAIKQLMESPAGGKPGLGMLQNLLAGYLAGVMNMGVSLPLEVLATRLQVAPTGTSLRSTVKTVYAESGLAGFYKGFAASVILCINPAITNTVFEQLKHRMCEWMGVKALTTSQAFIIGVIAKIVATLCTYPLSRAKTIMQAGSMKSSAAADTKSREPSDVPAKSERLTMVDVLKRIIATEGPAGLFKGLQSQLFRTVLASALLLTVKERVATRTALFLQIAVLVIENPSFVAGMVQSRLRKLKGSA